ncbi:hypothetical protein [Fusobacterium ulcerans]|uniref:hypothetical protein n=1 Tax=Fusobacterium ulcerans TaxID=861 RepID=UPI001D0B7329|nr:hypothetical protein [Fusobacterium ulcerans]MCB8564493.1 hypothetical protein [Fusobacterium ulcerans]MCB8648664.1 hypothetical protein [Fusobacterium ulcerans]
MNTILTKTFCNEGKEFSKKQEIILFSFLLFFTFGVLTYSSLSGLPIEANLTKYLSMVVRIFRFVVAFGIIFSLMAFFKGSQMWMMGLGIIVVGLIVSNLETILDLIGLTGGVCF